MDNIRPNGSTLLNIYRCATLIRQNDERAHKVIKSGRIVTPYYSAKGQEIIPSALSMHLTNADYICTTYRGLHDSLAKGLSLKRLWAELAGRISGTCKGKGGAMHITDPSLGIMVTSGIVGSTMPIATGLALGAQLSAAGQVVVANFGDGASNIGSFHESLNMASIWKLPVIFMCQNNRWGEHTAYANSTSVDCVSKRAAGYGMRGVTVNGNDPDEMFTIAGEAVGRARAGDGPTLIEAVTYRLRGHLFGDAGEYMDRDELASAIENDPLPRLRSRLIADGIATVQEIEQIELDIEHDLDEAINAALADPFPDVSELGRDVFQEEIS